MLQANHKRNLNVTSMHSYHGFVVDLVRGEWGGVGWVEWDWVGWSEWCGVSGLGCVGLGWAGVGEWAVVRAGGWVGGWVGARVGWRMG